LPCSQLSPTVRDQSCIIVSDDDDDDDDHLRLDVCDLTWHVYNTCTTFIHYTTYCTCVVSHSLFRRHLPIPCHSNYSLYSSQPSTISGITQATKNSKRYCEKATPTTYNRVRYEREHVNDVNDVL
jgi:hypothetical protein